MKQQIAVEWLIGQLRQLSHSLEAHLGTGDVRVTQGMIDEFEEQAKQMEKQDKIDFLVWLKENRWHVYKNGKWFTTTDQPYIDSEPRKTYTEEQVIQKYDQYGKENNN